MVLANEPLSGRLPEDQVADVGHGVGEEARSPEPRGLVYDQQSVGPCYH